jgi:16S rRNA (uracil1498-N3)-methyltransferase
VTAPHFFVDRATPIEPGHRIKLSEEDSRHALRSLRLRAGEMVTVADDEGLWASGTLVGEEDRRAVILLQDVRPVARREAILSVALAPPKGDRLAWAVQKLGELGVDEVVLVRTSRSIRDWTPDRAAKAADRLRSIAREAAMQSRRPFIMSVAIASNLEEALDVAATVVVLWEGADTPLHQALPPDESAVRLVIGPEGSFSDEELDAARSRGAALVTLGPGILRTETAALVGATLALARYGRLG